MLVAGGPVSGNRWLVLDIHSVGWLGGMVRAYEKLATGVKVDTRVVPAEEKLFTGADIVRYRDIYQKLFAQMFVYFNKGYGPSDAVAARPLKGSAAEITAGVVIGLPVSPRGSDQNRLVPDGYRGAESAGH